MYEQNIRDQEMRLKEAYRERDMAQNQPAGFGASTMSAMANDQWSSAEFIRDIVSHHGPSPEEISHIGAIRTATEMFIRAISEHCPISADRAAAIRHAREAMMTANASIVLRGRV